MLVIAAQSTGEENTLLELAVGLVAALSER